MRRVKYGDVVQEIKINIDRATDDHEFFIAGEHMDSDNIHITRRGRFSDSDVGPAFTRLFRPGQILYGSRRTYLKKVSVADFEGITSNTTFVLETKDSNEQHHLVDADALYEQLPFSDDHISFRRPGKLINSFYDRLFITYRRISCFRIRFADPHHARHDARKP